MTSKTVHSFRLGKWLVEPDMHRVSCASEVRQLEPKAMEVLTYLCDRPGRVVSADELIDAVWDGRPMGDNPVYKSIAKLRRALDDESDGPSLIVTVPKRGYKVTGLADDPSRDDAARGAWRQLAVPVLAGLVIGIGLAALLLWRPATEPASFVAVSTFAGSHSQPSFAPDGRRFAFISDADGTPHLWVAGSDESSPTQLTFGSAADARPRWSPDGGTILLMRDGGIWAIPAEGGEPSELIRDASNANWSRDGRRIVFERRYGVWTADADGGNQTNVTTIPQSELALAQRWPAFSPSGDQIVFFEGMDSPEGDLWIADLKTARVRQLTNSPAFGGAPVWSPDGDEIIYSSQRGGSRTLWSVNPSDGTATALLVGSGDDDFPDLSSNGERIIYSNSRERFLVLRSDPETGVERVLHESRLTLIGPELSPDGERIVLFGPASTGGIQLLTLPIEGGTVDVITSDPAATHAIPRWSADGDSIYFFYNKATSAYGRIAAAGGEIETIAAGWNWSIANGASVDPNDDRVMYSRLDGQAPIQTLIRHLGDSRDETFHATLEYPRWSKDGTTVVGSMFTNQRFPGDVAVCSAADGDCRTIAEQARIPMWSADESSVYFVRGFGVRQELFVAKADGGGTETKLLDMAPLAPLGPFYSVTADGDIIWVRHEKDPGAIWVITRSGGDNSL